MSPAKEQPERWIDTATDCLFCGAPTNPEKPELEIHSTECTIYKMREEQRERRRRSED